jgi:hypothetical protein
VTVNGSDLGGATSVTFGGTAGTITGGDATHVYCTTPLKPEGLVRVEVTTGSGTGGKDNAYEYMDPPSITSLDQNWGSTVGGDMITIYGSDFTDVTAVSFCGTPAALFGLVDDGEIWAFTDAHAPEGWGDVVVTTPWGSGTLVNGFEYRDPPSIVSVNPGQGSTAGGTLVTITGDDLAGATVVTFGGTPAAITGNTDTEVYCTTDLHLPEGLVDVVVATVVDSATKVNGYEYMDPPDVVNIDPNQGPVTGGTPVTITGTNLAGATSVKVGPNPLGGVVVTDTKITGVTGGFPAESFFDVFVEIPGIGSDTLPGAFQAMDPPSVASVSPNQGPAAGGTPVTITGEDFLSTPPCVTTVTIGGAPAVGVVVASDTQIYCDTPSGSEGPADVAVTSPGGTGTLVGGFTYYLAPTVTSINPNQGPTAGGTKVTIVGTKFVPGFTSVSIGGVAATVTGCIITEVYATTGVHGAATVNVDVTTPGGTGTLVNGYTYVAPPTITSVAPSQGPVATETAVAVHGSGYTLTAPCVVLVRFGGAPASNVVVVSDTELTCKTPALPVEGPVTVEVETPGGLDVLPDGYEYMDPPDITSVSPNKGTTAGGTPVTINGNDLAGATSATFDGLPATITGGTDTEVYCTTPAHPAPMLVDVAVTTAWGSDTAVGAYEYVTGPVVTSVTPSSGPSTGSTNVTIAGSNLTGATGADFGGSAAAITGGNDSEVYCTTSPHPPAIVNVTVTTPGGSGMLPNGYEYTAAPPQFTTLPSANPNPGVVNREIAFTCGVSGTPPLTVEWTFGDGGNATGESVAHTYRKPKQAYAVVAKVTDGHGLWTEASVTPAMMVRSVFGEFDVDSFFDIVWWEQASGQTQAWLMNGTTLVEERLMGMENPALYDVVGASDVNRDGKPDLLLWYRSVGGVYVRIMDGTTPGALYRIGGANATMWSVVGGMDLDADGTGDILFRRSDGVVWAWRLNPGTPPTVAAIVRIGSASVANWICATGVGDINGDGQCDILWERVSPHSAYIWVMMPGGTGVASQGTIAAEAANWSPRGAGDYDGDGLEDLLWRDQAAGQNKLWKMNGLIKVGDIPLDPKAGWRMVGPK